MDILLKGNIIIYAAGRKTTANFLRNVNLWAGLNWWLNIDCEFNSAVLASVIGFPLLCNSLAQQYLRQYVRDFRYSSLILNMVQKVGYESDFIILNLKKVWIGSLGEYPGTGLFPFLVCLVQ